MVHMPYEQCEYARALRLALAPSRRIPLDSYLRYPHCRFLRYFIDIIVEVWPASAAQGERTVQGTRTDYCGARLGRTTHKEGHSGKVEAI